MAHNKAKSLFLSFLMAIPAVGTLAVPKVAFAELEEIVVTARARAESLQDVPAIITAFTQSQIDNM